MELRRRKLPKPTFPAIKKAYLAISKPHLCQGGILHSEKGLVVSGIRMGEALSKSIAPLCRIPEEGVVADDRPGLRAFDYELLAGSTCLHGYPRDAEGFETFLRSHWGNPDERRGENSEIEEYRGRQGVILFTSIGSKKKENDKAMVRGNAGIALWENDDAIGPSYWEAARILFWELELEGGRKAESVISVPSVDTFVEKVKSAITPEPEEENAPDTEKPPPPKKKELTELGMYCPNPYDRAPQAFVEEMEESDLRNYSDANANEVGKRAYAAAVHGVPGGKQSEREQAFWSGAGRKLIVDDKHPDYMAQEHGGGAKTLDAMGKRKELSGWTESKPFSEDGEDSGITNERIWKTISMRSAENASGEVSAFVAGGQAVPKNVFASVELPTLLHNDKVKAIHFKNPDKPNDPPITWRRNAKGCWEGEAVPGGVSEFNKTHPDENRRKPLPGFALHDKLGFVRPAEKTAA